MGKEVEGQECGQCGVRVAVCSPAMLLCSPCFVAQDVARVRFVRSFCGATTSFRRRAEQLHVGTGGCLGTGAWKGETASARNVLARSSSSGPPPVLPLEHLVPCRKMISSGRLHACARPGVGSPLVRQLRPRSSTLACWLASWARLRSLALASELICNPPSVPITPARFICPLNREACRRAIACSFEERATRRMCPEASMRHFPPLLLAAVCSRPSTSSLAGSLLAMSLSADGLEHTPHPLLTVFRRADYVPNCLTSFQWRGNTEGGSTASLLDEGDESCSSLLGARSLARSAVLAPWFSAY